MKNYDFNPLKNCMEIIEKEISLGNIDLSHNETLESLYDLMDYIKTNYKDDNNLIMMLLAAVNSYLYNDCEIEIINK